MISLCLFNVPASKSDSDSQFTLQNSGSMGYQGCYEPSGLCTTKVRVESVFLAQGQIPPQWVLDSIKVPCSVCDIHGRNLKVQPGWGGCLFWEPMRMSQHFKCEAVVLSWKMVDSFSRVGSKLLPQVKQFVSRGLFHEWWDRQVDAASALLWMLYWSVVGKKELSQKAWFSSLSRFLPNKLNFAHVSSDHTSKHLANHM